MLIRFAGTIALASTARAIVVVALAAVPTLSVGCAMSAEECGTGLERPHFGEALSEFLAEFSELPDETASEWNDRAARVGDSFDRLFSARGREWDLTSARVAALPSRLGDECVDDRPPRLFSFLGRQGQRVVDDACCFPTRAWHSIKLAIE